MINGDYVLSSDLHDILKDYISSEDILEDPNFDAIAYLNEKFSTFESLDKLPDFINQWENEYNKLDEELDSLMMERAKYNGEMKNHMNELNSEVASLVSLVGNVKKNTDVNETTVKSICNDIKSLDNARQNITTTINSLTKLVVLNNAVESLEISVKNKNYSEASNQIEACNDLLKIFEEYQSISQINQLSIKKEQLCSALAASIQQEFKNNLIHLPASEETLYNACKCANFIGGNALNNIKTWFCSYKLQPYEDLFDPRREKDIVGLVDTERRFEWLKRVLIDFSKYEYVFPPSWGMKYYLCLEFFRVTKLQLNELLSDSYENSKLKVDSDVLVKVLNTTINFENYIDNFLTHEYNKVSDFLKFLSEDKVKKNDYNSIVEEIKNKFENAPILNFYKKKTDPNKEPLYSLMRIKGLASETFEPYMISYVTNEEKKLISNLNDYKMSDKIEGKLWKSSLLMFRDVQQAIHRCLSFSQGKTFYDLNMSFKNVFSNYNSVLQNKFKMYSSYFNLISVSNSINANTNINNVQLKQEEKIFALNSLSTDDIKSICISLNTCDYCSTTINSLLELVKGKSSLLEDMSFEQQEKSFQSSYKPGLEIFTVFFRLVLMENFSNILKSNWFGNEEFTVSNYVDEIKKRLMDTFKIIREYLYENFSLHLLNSLPKMISETFLYYMYRIKKIDSSGSQNLIMDVCGLRKMITEIYKELTGKPSEDDFNYNW